MKVYYNYLNDSSFLQKLTKLHIKTYFVKITILNWKEEPINNVQGRVVSANINIDGKSSMRRTANLSIVLDEGPNLITNAENVLALNKKINLEIGYYNTTDEYLEYPILWFPLGTYVIISCSISESTSGHVASIQLQDKMCLLNGTVGGRIPAAADLHLIDTLDDTGKWVTNYTTMYQIIQELVHHYGQEQLGKIIISDLDNRVKQAMRWGLNQPLYYLAYEQQELFYLNENNFQEAINNLESGTAYTTKIYQKGQDIGYIYTDFIYPGELIADAGSSVTDILDQILEVLGNYEYFYDLDGNFVFQEKKNFFNNAQAYYIERAAAAQQPVPDYVASQSGSSRLDAYLINMSSGTAAFQFEDSDFITSYSNTPQYGAIKNDFIIWGTRSTLDGNEYPIRYHLAIDSIPNISNTKYLMFNYKEYSLDKYGIWIVPTIVGELSGYGNPTITSDFPSKPTKDDVNHYYYNNGQILTGVYNSDWEWKVLDFPIVTVVPNDYRTQLLIQGAAAQNQGLETNYYYAELKNEWPKIYNLIAHESVDKTYYTGDFYSQVTQTPTGIDYFLDIIDAGDAQVGEFAVDNIGRRSYVFDAGKNVNCIFQDWIPDFIVIKNGQGEDTQKDINEAQVRGQKFILIPVQIYDNLKIGGVFYSAYQEIRQTLHDFTNFNNTITLQTVPLYFLQPNTRISINNPNSDIQGDYLIDSMSFSLDNQGLLTINASKAVEKI